MKKSKDKKEIHINNKIFSKKDLINFFRLFIGQTNKILEKSKEIRRQDLIREGLLEKNINESYINTVHSDIILTSSDNSNHTFAFDDIAEAVKSLDEKIISEIELQFNEKVSECRLSAKLRNSGPSYIFAEGRDSEWIDITIKTFEDFLAACRNQSGFVRKFKYPIILAIISLFSYFLVNFIKFFIKAEVSFPKIVANIFKDDLGYYIVLFALVSATPAFLIYRWLKKLYPEVELQTGPDTGKVVKERRIKIFLLVLAIIVPVIISFLIK